MFIVTIDRRKQYRVNDIRTAADIVYGELGNESDLERLPYILGNMRFDEMFHGNGFVVQCFPDERRKKKNAEN